MQRHTFNRFILLTVASAALWPTVPTWAADEAPDVFIKRLSGEVLHSIKGDKSLQSGDVSRMAILIDEKIMPNVDFQRMTALAVGNPWTTATPDQQKRLQDEFRILLTRTYSNVLAQAGDQAIVVKPLRDAPAGKEVVVRTEVRGRSDPVQLDYRLEKTPGQGSGWQIYNLNVGGVWLVEVYASQFAPLIAAKGLDGLIATLSERNRSTAKKS